MVGKYAAGVQTASSGKQFAAYGLSMNATSGDTPFTATETFSYTERGENLPTWRR